QTGFFGGNGMIVKTTDGGASFTSHSVANVVGGVEKILFKDANTGFVLLKEQIYKTMDGGQNWTLVFQDTADHYLLYCIGIDFPQNGPTGFVINRQAELLKTVDNGNTWQSMGRIADTINAASMHFLDTQTGYLGSLDPLRFDRAGGIYRTDDGGQTWVLQYGLNPSVVQGPIKTIGMANSQTGFAMMSNQLLKTINGGIGFREIKTEERIQLFPNPAHTYFELQVPEGGKIQTVNVSDLGGRLLKSWARSQETYSVHGLPAGVYLVEVKTERSISTIPLRIN
ncbi:MAG: WD40/YVTN/BNR-like repeat-containing protein, partial [Owenweeksia sp.]